ncbi:MAG: class I SAM-dependent methyltransferase [Magnetovibrio sp.]|nr:class I SAM-dependent methyltransferase [Magnetovibrio sp.]
MTDKIANKTINDFGRQHETYNEYSGFYGSVDILADTLGPLMSPEDFAGKDVLDLGAGTGRWMHTFHNLGAKNITAIEPSSAINVARANTEHLGNITYHHVPGDKIPDGQHDYVFSFGVVHHIPDPDPVMKRVYEVLKPGGKAIIWLYGRENNGLYLAFMHTLRVFTVRMPDRALDGLSKAMVPMVRLYSKFCKFLPLPLKGYMSEYIDQVEDYYVQVTIYDQLNPQYAMYYRRQEAIDLMERAGFTDIQIYHREKYSWTVIGTKN